MTAKVVTGTSGTARRNVPTVVIWPSGVLNIVPTRECLGSGRANTGDGAMNILKRSLLSGAKYTAVDLLATLPAR